MTEHTPLPWKVEPPSDEDDPGGLVLEGGNGDHIADLCGPNQVADARLIVAAVTERKRFKELNAELLDVLKELRDSRTLRAAPDAQFHRAMYVIAKAEATP